MRKYIMLFIIVISIVFIYNFYSKNDDIKIGFVAGLSGKYSYLGHGVLNGLNLALEETNYKIDEKKIHLEKKDDNQNSSKALNIINYFKEKKYNLIIGNTTSSMTKVSIDIVNKEKNMLLFSPTASSNDFSGKDDNFLRLQVAQTVEQFDKLTEYLNKKSLKDIFIIYDPKNKSYSQNYITNFKKNLEENISGFTVNMASINSPFELIHNKLNDTKHDVVMVVANSLDSSKIIQFLRIKGEKKEIISSGWAKTKEFLENGGKHVEDVVFLTTYDNNSQSKVYLDFLRNYKKKYNSTPSVFAAQSYETGKIIIQILKTDINLNNLKKNILEKKVFDGLQGKIIFDKYGDIHRDSFLMIVKNNNFEKIDKF